MWNVQRYGMYNDINGLENHLVQLEKGFLYEVPSKDSPPALVAKKKQKYEKKKKPVKKRKRKRKAKPAKKKPKKKKAKRRRKSNKRSYARKQKHVFVNTTIFTKQKILKNPPIFFPVVRPPYPSFENPVTFGRVLQAALTCSP